MDFRSGDWHLELGGDVSGVPRAHWLADHELGVDAPGLRVEAIDWVLGKDLVSAAGDEGMPGRPALWERML